MTVTAVTPEQLVETRLDFLEPMEATARATFRLEPTDDGTRVTWRMDGENNFAAKAFSLVMSMDAMIGSQFEHGLDALRALVESDATEQTSAAES